MMNNLKQQLYRWIIEHADLLPCTVRAFTEYDNLGKYSHLILMRPNGQEIALSRSVWYTENEPIYSTSFPDVEMVWAELKNNLVTYEQQGYTSPVKLVQDTQLLLSLSPVHIDQMIWRRRCLLYLRDNVSDSNFSTRISELIHQVTECLENSTQEPDLIQIKNPKPIAAA